MRRSEKVQKVLTPNTIPYIMVSGGIAVSKWDKLLKRICSLSNDLRFSELQKVLESFGYVLNAPRGDSSHYTFRKPGCPPITPTRGAMQFPFPSCRGASPAARPSRPRSPTQMTQSAHGWKRPWRMAFPSGSRTHWSITPANSSCASPKACTVL